MALYQASVLKKYLKQQDQETVQKAYKKYAKYFLNPTIQDNIRTSKEEQFQATFLTELFVNILGYTLNPNPNFNLTTEFKNQKNARKADGAILKDDTAIAVIELKGTKTKDLESIRRQAFDYKANQKGCVYVITSNFEKLRFYINDATEFEEFNLFELTEDRFHLLYLCLHKDHVLTHVPLAIKEASIVEEEKITKSFYNDYSIFKRELFRDLVKQNGSRLKTEARETLKDITTDAALKSELERAEKNVKLSLFKKSQKLIDRFLFIFFAEDRGLLPPNSTVQILNKWKADVDFGDERPLYDLFKQYFNFLDIGRQGTTSRAEIYAYNGGLFKPDTILDSLTIDNELLYKYTLKLANYDFESQVDVNILGHIFENSLNEIESVNADIQGGDFDKQKSKRKKDGVFYTPKYITKYIVENTVGKLCEEKKTELGFQEEEYFKGRKNRNKTTITKLVQLLDDYRAWLLQLTICDPACGSGAFLNQALDFLIKEHRYIDELKAKILGGGIVFSDIENTILENNIYGVDLNEESVEIAKLSLWLRTAQPRRKLNDLSSNIKCGNSLIDDKKVAGDKAFHWETAFAKVFKNGGFDVVIGNPPYVYARGENMSESTKAFYNRFYNVATYQLDLYILFLEKSISLIKNSGLVSFITPNTWLNNLTLKPVRKFLLSEVNFIEMVNTPSDVFAGVNVDTIIGTFSKKPNIYDVKLVTVVNNEFNITGSINQSNWLNNKDYTIDIFTTEEIKTILNNVYQKSLLVNEIAEVNRGVGVYHKRIGHTKEFINEDPFQSVKKDDETFVPYLRGRNLQPRFINWDSDSFISYGDWLAEPRQPSMFENQRIVIRKILSNGINASMIHNKFVVDQQIYTLQLTTDQFGYDFVLGLLTSKLMTFVFRYKFSEFDSLFPQIKLAHIKQLPIFQNTNTSKESIQTSSYQLDEIISILQKLMKSFYKLHFQ
ncbi:N-6 DNA methylase [uncultured Dokdonia sp.]|uniref:Eco57I restriction-modification methylase domain-containing protein n=1 Tax=uncultured Dokdonia sp. TaxID=575653 RepID=UPI0026223A1E|nr:N-6 DNA methylase [uncultured Dokdonia sp.]